MQDAGGYSDSQLFAALVDQGLLDDTYVTFYGVETYKDPSSGVKLPTGDFEFWLAPEGLWGHGAAVTDDQGVPTTRILQPPSAVLLEDKADPTRRHHVKISKFAHCQLCWGSPHRAAQCPYSQRCKACLLSWSDLPDGKRLHACTQPAPPPPEPPTPASEPDEEDMSERRLERKRRQAANLEAHLSSVAAYWAPAAAAPEQEEPSRKSPRRE